MGIDLYTQTDAAVFCDATTDSREVLRFGSVGTLALPYVHSQTAISVANGAVVEVNTYYEQLRNPLLWLHSIYQLF